MESLPYKHCMCALPSPIPISNPFFSIQIGRRNSRTQFTLSRQLPMTNATLKIQRWLSSILSHNCISTFTTRAAQRPFLRFRIPFDSQREPHSLTRWLRPTWTLLLVRYIPKWRRCCQGGCHIFFFTLCGIIHEYSQMAISNQNMRRCYRVFGQKISRTLSSSHTVELLVQTGSCMQCVVRMCCRNLGALSSICPFCSFLDRQSTCYIRNYEEARRPLPLPVPGNPEFWLVLFKSSRYPWADLKYTRAQRRSDRQVASKK